MQKIVQNLSYLNKLEKIFNIELSKNNSLYEKEEVLDEALNAFKIIKEKKLEITKQIPQLEKITKKLEDLYSELKQIKFDISEIDYIIQKSDLSEVHSKNKAILVLKEKNFKLDSSSFEKEKEDLISNINRLEKDIDNKIYVLFKIISPNNIKEEIEFINSIYSIEDEKYKKFLSLNTKTNKTDGLEIFKLFIEEKSNILFEIETNFKQKNNDFIIKNDILEENPTLMYDKIKSILINNSLTSFEDFNKSFILKSFMLNVENIKNLDIKTLLYNICILDKIGNENFKNYYQNFLILNNQILNNDKELIKNNELENTSLLKNLFLIIELLNFIKDKNFKEKAFQLDDSQKSVFLNIHGEKIDLFFNRKVTSDITNFEKTKLFLLSLFEKKQIDKSAFIDLFETFEKLFEEKEDKSKLEELYFKKEENIYDFLRKIKYINKVKINQLKEDNKDLENIMDEDEDEEDTEEEVEKNSKNNPEEEEEEAEETEEEDELDEMISLLKNNLTTETEKQTLLEIYFYYNKTLITERNKEIINIDFEILNLIEKIYLVKFDKLIQKTIHDEVKKRITSNNISGIISSSPASLSSEQSGTNTKPQKDDLLSLLKKEALSYAIEGFLIGIRRFEINQGNKLSTYSTWWLRQRVVYYIEKDSSLNKATKKVDNLKNYTFDDTEEENFRFHKFDNIKYANFNFQDIEGMSNNIIEKQDSIMSNSRKELMLDILMFFCKYKDIFLYHEYLLLKYDIFLEHYISFIDISPNKEIIDCFYEDINNLIVLLKEYDPEKYKDLEKFTKVTEYHKIPILLKKYFNLQEKKFLHVKRVLKQKLLNILTKIFVQEDIESLDF